MTMYAQQYENPSRIVTGTPVLTNDDVVLYCDTSAGAVTINLLDIPDNFWMTTWKLYVVDYSNNASTNNITINAGTGQTINGLASFVISVNSGSVLVQITGNTTFVCNNTSSNVSNLAVLNQGSLITSNATSMNFVGIQASAVGSAVTIQNNFISGTYVQITTLAAANSLIPSQNYEITNALFGTLPVINIAIYLTAISTNELSLTGSGYFYNADYDNVGVYTGVSGYAGQLGIWSLTLTPVVGNVCIWNNLQYVNTTGSNGVTNPSLDTTNWTFLAYSVTNGYIAEIDFIKYDIATNRIIERQDVRLNSVTWYTAGIYDSFNYFRWGHIKCISNQLIDSVLYNCNTLSNSLWNNLNLSTVIIGSSTVGGDVEMTTNEFISSTVTFNYQPADPDIFELNYIKNSGITFTKNNFTVLDVGVFIRNSVIHSGFSDLTLEGNYNQNNFESSTSSILNQTRVGYIELNNIVGGGFNIANNTGTISTNNFINSSLNITTINTDTISFNSVSESSTMTLGSNSVSIQYNVLISSSTLNIVNQTGIFLNNFLYNSSFTSSNQLGRMFGNNFDTSTILVTNCGSSIQNNRFKLCNITITTLNVSFSQMQVTNGVLNIITTNPSYSISDGIYIEGVATTKYILDLSDPTIFNAGTLAIPNGLAQFFGVFELLNCSGQNISKISTINSSVPLTLYPDSSTVIFTRTGVGVATANDIIASTATATWTLTYRPNGNDSIQLSRLGNLNGVIETEIYI